VDVVKKRIFDDASSNISFKVDSFKVYKAALNLPNQVVFYLYRMLIKSGLLMEITLQNLSLKRGILFY